MMSEIQYKDYANDIIDKAVQTYLDYHKPMTLSDYIESLVNQKEYSTLEAIAYWKERLTQNEIKKIKWYGDTFLTSINEEQRDITSALIADLNHHQRLRYLENSLRKYSINQPLFSSNQELLSQTLNNELIPSTQFQKVFRNIIRFSNGKYAYIDEFLECPLLQYIEERDITYYVRINPYYIYEQKPSVLIKEAAWRSPSPQWRNAIGIKPNHKDGFSYYIPDDIDENIYPQDIVDRDILNIHRRIEGRYKRERNGYFSMMVEELKEEKHPFLDDEYYIVGRMIHLDSDENGDKGLNTKLKHIDLSVNLYKGNDAKRRKTVRLEDGEEKVVANNRSHILRLNDAQLSDIIMFSTFFESKSLQDEWIKDMFTRSDA